MFIRTMKEEMMIYLKYHLIYRPSLLKFMERCESVAFFLTSFSHSSVEYIVSFSPSTKSISSTFAILCHNIIIQSTAIKVYRFIISILTAFDSRPFPITKLPSFELVYYYLTPSSFNRNVSISRTLLVY